MTAAWDRAAEDVGNLVALEHVNVRVPDQRLATLFYVTGLGLTRDPYLVTGVTNMWVNVGRSQLHLPTGAPQRLRGVVGLVTPELGGLAERLASVREALAGTAFEFTAADGRIEATCPWGNRFRIHGPEARFGNVRLGLAYVRFDAPAGAAPGIARFYAEVFGAPAAVEELDGAPAARVAVGAGQTLWFRETAAPEAPYDGHHIQVYAANFSGPWRRLAARGLISREDGPHQYRFTDVADEAGRVLFTLEHEVRSMTHPLYGRPLVNRNPDQTNTAYAPGYQDAPWALPHAG